VMIGPKVPLEVPVILETQLPGVPGLRTPAAQVPLGAMLDPKVPLETMRDQ